MTSDVPVASGSQSLTSVQPRVLGALWAVYGILRLAMTVWLIGFHITATLMFGALLTRVPNPFSLMTDFHFLYTGIIIWSGVCGVLGILAGVTLLAGRRAARVLAVVAALISLPEMPFGIMLGVYTLVVMLNAVPERIYLSRAART
jgi:hypothetical protein